MINEIIHGDCLEYVEKAKMRVLRQHQQRAKAAQQNGEQAENVNQQTQPKIENPTEDCMKKQKLLDKNGGT